MVRLEGIRKFFPAGGVEALAGADFELRPGEIHALLGENGAGKSTLMHVMAGYLEPSGGRIFLDGEAVAFRSPADALRAGIGMVRQHPRPVPGFAFWEECILGAEPRRFGLVDRRAARKKIVELSCRWGFDLDPDRKTDTLSVGRRQLGAVLSLLLREVRYIVLDEPTAVLTPQETERLFDLLRLLREEGHGIVLISHKLPETLAAADRVTVLRRGTTVAARTTADCGPETLSALMFGRSEEKNVGRGAGLYSSPNSTLPLRLRELSVRAGDRPMIRSVSLDLRAGELLGIAGVRDSGLETLELAVAGLLPPAGGSVEVFGASVGGAGCGAFRAAGGAYLGADRLGSAVAARRPLWESLTVHAHRRLRRGPFMDLRALESWTASIMEEAKVEGNAENSADSFSGGQLQRLTLAREFAEGAPLLVLAEPGWGLDASGRRLLEDALRRHRERGGAALLFSTDVDELLSLCGRILVLRDGVVGAEIDLSDPAVSAQDARELIGAAMIGSEACVDA